MSFWTKVTWGIFHNTTLNARVTANTKAKVMAHIVRCPLLAGAVVVSVKHGLPGVMGPPVGPAVKRPARIRTSAPASGGRCSIP